LPADVGPTVVAHDGYQQGFQLDLTSIGAHRAFGLPTSEIARRVGHAEISIDGVVVMLSDEYPTTMPSVRRRSATPLSRF